MEKIGVTDRENYFIGGTSRIRSVEKTIHWDTAPLATVPTPQNFLLAGCSQPTSIRAMVELISRSEKSAENRPYNLFVIDIDLLAVSKIRAYLQKTSAELAPFVNIQIIQGNLLQLPVADKKIDYIRLDSTQNFIPFEDQQLFVQELHRILSDTGAISNVLRTTDRLALIKSQKPFKPWLVADGCCIQESDAYNMLILSRNKMKQLCKTAGLSCDWGQQMPKEKSDVCRLEQVVMRKQFTPINFRQRIKNIFSI